MRRTNRPPDRGHERTARDLPSDDAERTTRDAATKPARAADRPGREQQHGGAEEDQTEGRKSRRGAATARSGPGND